MTAIARRKSSPPDPALEAKLIRVGQRILSIAAKRGFDRRALAARLNWDRQRLDQVLAGKHALGFVTSQKLANVLECATGEFLDEPDEQHHAVLSTPVRPEFLEWANSIPARNLAPTKEEFDWLRSIALPPTRYVDPGFYTMTLKTYREFGEDKEVAEHAGRENIALREQVRRQRGSKKS